MITANWQYITLQPPKNGVFRVKKRMDGPPPIFQSGIDSINSDIWTRTAPPTLLLGPQGNQIEYVFAFWDINIMGIGVQPVSVPFFDPLATYKGGGNLLINAIAYYVESRFGPGGDNGVFIDAYDLDIHDFIGDNFVQVQPDDPIKKTFTFEANDGYINSGQIDQKNPITITATDPLPSNKQFLYWAPVQVSSANPVNPVVVGSPDPHEIVANHNDLIYAFAFYTEIVTPNKYQIQLPTYNFLWYIVTHRGLTPPWIGGDPWMPQLLASLSLSDAAKSVSKNLRRDVLEIISEQLSLVAKEIKNEINRKE